MFWSVDLEVRIAASAPRRVRLCTGELLGRTHQPGLDDPRISRTAARLAEDAAGPHLDEINSLYDLTGARLERLPVTVGATAALTPDGAVTVRISRAEREQPTLQVQRLGDVPKLLHGPAWRLDLSATAWLLPAASLAAPSLGFVRAPLGGWQLLQPHQPPRQLRAGDELRLGDQRLFLLEPLAAAPVDTVQSGAPTPVTFRRHRRAGWISVQRGGRELTLTGAPFHALNALLDSPQFTDSDALAARAQRGWKPNNLNVAIHELRTRFTELQIDLDDYYQKASGSRRFRLRAPDRLDEVTE